MTQDQHVNPEAAKGPGKIIAVGGAKGGIGKSLLVANLGVLLSQLGKKTVVVDLDLGSANLHLYMGIWSLPRRIDDFLGKTVSTINDIMIPTKYGPWLIGGGMSKLGAANIHFSCKLKLLRALKTIEADYVILDLGGDTTYNNLDFYLAANQGVVLTTCEPASYMDAYGFIKLALQRQLTRLFGAESTCRRERDRQLEQLIRAFFMSGGSSGGGHLSELLERIESQHPDKERFVKGVVDGFCPSIIVSMARTQEQTDELVARLNGVSRRILSIDLNCLGHLPFDERVQQSANDLVPYVFKTPKGSFAKALRRIALKMEMV